MSATPAGLEDRIAIVGMACRVPGAGDVEAFWRNLVAGVESIETLSEEELRAAGVPEALLQDPRYVRAGGFLPDVEGFDGELFGLTPREAAMLDPQHRLLMECAWHALEHAGHTGGGRRLRVGVYAGVANSAYYHANVRASLDPRDTASAYQALIGGERDFLATRLAYFFDLSGPGVNVQTACSTSLVATHLACQALLAGECDMALAGGAAVRLPQRVGYLYEEGMILSRDGHCRAFDADASGTVIGNGAGMVVLRRLEDALADGDTVHAVILASAVNNDGARKAGYTAPGIEGQAAVVREAQSLAGIDAASIGYVEAHGTGTPLGDPIEVAALTEAFRRSTDARGFCALGSVKSNVGHLDIAAGVVGLIKAALSVARGVIPPSLHLRRPNPALGLEKTPFFVPQSSRPWPAGVRRAAVSSFGIGGTNAHIVLEAPEARPAQRSARRWQVLCTSARTAAAHRNLSGALARYLADKPPAAIADVAFTTGVGRRALEWRRALVCDDASKAAEELRREPVAQPALAQRRVAFVFTDGDEDGVAAGEALASREAVFRSALAEARGAVRNAGLEAAPEARVFALQYALTALWRACGVTPHVALGFGVGEYAAAVAAGALTLAQALRLLAARGDAARLRAAIADLTLSGPSTPWISAGGRRHGKAGAIDPAVLEELGTRPRDAAALRALLEERDLAVLELGPAATLAPWVQSASGPSTVVASSCDAEAEDASHAIAKALARLWSCGVSVDWNGYYSGEERRRVPLPLYPFERTRRWIEPCASQAPAAAAPASAPATLQAHRTTWMRAPGSALPARIGGEWLIAGDLHGLAARLASRLENAGSAVTVAHPGSEDCEAFLRAAREPRIVLLDATYETLVALGATLVRGHTGARLIAVTQELHGVIGNEAVRPLASLVLGPVRVLPQEYPEIACRNVDLAAEADGQSDARLLAECAAEEAPPVVALRGAHRWCPATEPMALAAAPPAGEAPVYLIVGGAGMMGLALARHLHRTEGASLVLVGRTPLPPPGEWRAAADEPVTFDIDAEEPPGDGDKLASLAALQAQGARVLYVAADASDPDALRDAFAKAEARFGRVDVVVHAAAAPAGQAFTAFEQLTAAVAARHFTPKVDGVEALRAIVREKRPRACVLMSSLASVLGGLGFTAYAAANAYLDAVAQCEDGVDGVRWLSLGWDAWQSPQPARAANAGVISRGMIEPADGAEIFRRALASPGASHILVAAGDLGGRLARASRAPGGEPVETASAAVAGPGARVATEDLIASTWRELLGVESIGPDDDFYELGGNSLLATQVVSKLRRALAIELPVRVLFEQTTVAGLARHIDALPARGAAEQALAP